MKQPKYIRWGNRFTRFAELLQFLKQIPTDDSCMAWPFARNAGGYGDLRVGGKVIMVHRVAYQLTYGDIEDSVKVLHRCDNPPCFRPSHLFIGNQMDNMRDCWRKGRMFIPRRIGNGCGNTQVSEEQVQQILKEYAAGAFQRDLAEKFHTSRSNISLIVLRKTRGHVPVL